MFERFFFNLSLFFAQVFGVGTPSAASATTSPSALDLLDEPDCDIGKSLYTAFEFADD